MNKFLIWFLLILSFSFLYSDLIEKTYSFDEPVLYQEKGYNRILLNDMIVVTRPGYPELPSRQIKLLLPPGEAVKNLEIITENKIEITEKIDLFPIQEPYPLSFEGKVEFTEQDKNIFSSEDIYPSRLCRNEVTQYHQGHSIFLAELTPFEYDPASKKLYYYESVTIVLETDSSPEAESSYRNFFRSSAETGTDISLQVQNPELIADYPDNPELRDEIVDLFIITSGSYENVFADFVTFKKSQGYSTEIKLTEDIYVEYSGVDNAAKIRNFIIDAYQNYGTNYVILGGDTEIIPHRGFYLAAGTTIDDDLPSDLYYSGLDRVGAGSGPDWNTDNDSRWGETNEADYFAEIMIGRISADTEAEFSAALNKQIMYQDSPVIADLEKAIMVGENLNNSPLTWGGTYKDEIVNGGYYNGYSTTGFPGYFAMQTQYDRTSTWSWTELRDRFNSGVNLVNHLGHSSNSFNMKFYTSYVTDANLTSNGINHNFYIIYSQGCYPAAFDNRNSSGNYGSDVIVEEFTTIDNGCVAFLGNTRYGWYNPGGTNSGSQYLDRQFFDALFGENIYQIAAMHEDSRADGASQCNGDPWFRWAYYEVTLFGDPSLDVWTETPTSISASYNSGMQLGASQIEFETNAPGARIGLMQAGELIGRGLTDSNGDLLLELFEPLTSDSEIAVSIISHNRIRHNGSISVYSDEPYVIYNSSQLDDSAGNNNGSADYGETIGLSIELINSGNQPANNVNVLLTANDPGINLIDDNEVYGLIEASGTESINNGFQMTVADNVADQTEVVLELEVTADDRATWYSDFSIILNAPELQIISWQIDDSFSGNGNGRLDPDETVDLILQLQNTGHSISPVIAVDLTTEDTDVTINTGSIDAGTLVPDEIIALTYNVTTGSSVSTGTTVQFDCAINAGNYSLNDSETFVVGLIAENFESDSFDSFGWQFSGNADWFVSTTSPYEGSYCSESGNIGDNSTSDLYLEAQILSAGEISFYRKVSSEVNYDYLRFYIDGSLQDQWSGEQSWARVSYPVSSGLHTFKWSFYKDGSVSSGSDCGWIDYIVFPALALPVISVNPISFDESVQPQTIISRILNIENSGSDNTDLIYSLQLDFPREFDDAAIDIETRDISGSTFEPDQLQYSPGTTFDLVFTIYNASPDNEWFAAATLDFPAGVTVNSSTDFDGPSGDLVTNNNTGDGAQINWTDNNGGWGNILPGESATTQINVTVNADFNANMVLNWSLTGDIYGSQPHEISGQIVLTPSWLTLSSLSGSLTGGNSDNIDIIFNSNGLTQGLYSANIVIDHTAGAPLIIPVSMNVSVVNFTINGTVLLDGAPLENVLMQGTNTTPESVLTRSSGTYSFTVANNSAVVIQPQKTGYDFIPALYQNNITENTTVDFAAIEWLPGQPQNGLPQGTNVPVDIAEISWDAPGDDIPVTFYKIKLSENSDYSDALIDTSTISNNYPLTGIQLEYEQEYYVSVIAHFQIPERGDGTPLEWSFLTEIHKVTLNGYILRGLIPVEDVTITDSVLTDENGYYAFEMNYGDSITIRPQKINYTFSPEFVVFPDLTENVEQDFQALKHPPATPIITDYINTGDNIQISWEPVPGVLNYRIYSSDNPYTGFTIEATVTSTSWSTTRSEGKRFYRITAVN